MRLAPHLLLTAAALTVLIGCQFGDGWALGLVRLCAGAIVWSLLLMLYRWRTVRIVIWLLISLLPFEIVCRIVYRTFLTPGTLQAILQTNLQEATELLGRHPEWLIAGIPWMIIALLAALASWSSPEHYAPHRLRRSLWIAGIGLVVSSSALYATMPPGPSSRAETTQIDLRRSFRAAFPVDGIYSAMVIARAELYVRSVMGARSRFVFDGVSRPEAVPGPETYVVVIGETSRRGSWSLFGYPRTTNPRLNQWLGRGLHPFRNVRSNANLTIFSVPLALTRATPREPWRSARERSIIGLANQAGFETWWISNQNQFGVWDRRVSAIATDAQHVHFLPRTTDDLTAYDESYDEGLVPELARILHTPPGNPKRIIFLHTMGGHFDYRLRVPPSRMVFSSPAFRGSVVCCSPEQRARSINAYDDTVLYTDWLLDRVISMLSQESHPTAVFYFADHGERLWCPRYPLSSFSHGNPIPSTDEVEVPAFVWLSDRYREAYPGVAENAARSATLPTSLASVFDTLADLAHIRVARLRDTTSLLAAAPVPATRDIQLIDSSVRPAGEPDLDCGAGN